VAKVHKRCRAIDREKLNRNAVDIFSEYSEDMSFRTNKENYAHARQKFTSLEINMDKSAI
jgi:hypothetical protein